MKAPFIIATLFFTSLLQAQSPACSGVQELSTRSYGFTKRTWPGQIIPFEISGSLPAGRRDFILNEINQINETTNVCLVPHLGEVDYLRIIGDDGNVFSSSHLGYEPGGEQFITTNSTRAIFQHEIGHALGLIHEHQRPDRDEYVTILYENIVPEFAHNFNLFVSSKPTRYDEYDYESVMHYHNKAFSKNNRSTIRAVETTGGMGGFSFSDLDIANINHIYPDSTINCQLAAIERPPKVEILLPTESEERLCVNTVYQFSANVSGSSANHHYEWQFPTGNPVTSNDPSPQVAFTSTGAERVILEVTNDFGTTKEEILVTIKVPETETTFLGMDNANQRIILEINNALPRQIPFSLMDVTGKIVKKFNPMVETVCKELLFLPLNENLATGIYFLSFSTEETTETHGIFIK